MKHKENNFAYIDGANLHKGVKELGWRLDYKKLRVWLSEKYEVRRAYIFLGFIPSNANVYRDLQNWGYTVIFKPTIPDKHDNVKGNCDAELVLQAVSDMYEERFWKAVIVTGDGDFACLVKFLREKDKFLTLISPNHRWASSLLKKEVSGNIVFLENMRIRFEYAMKKAPERDKTRS
jgi:uncharacterized LabA/DUF88 family protein